MSRLAGKVAILVNDEAHSAKYFTPVVVGAQIVNKLKRIACERSGVA